MDSHPQFYQCSKNPNHTFFFVSRYFTIVDGSILRIVGHETTTLKLEYYNDKITINISPYLDIQHLQKCKKKEDAEHAIIFFLDTYGSFMLETLHQYIRHHLEQSLLLIKGYKNLKVDDFFSSFGCTFSYFSSLSPKVDIFNTNKEELCNYGGIQTIIHHASAMSCKLKLNKQNLDYIQNHVSNITSKKENDTYLLITFNCDEEGLCLCDIHNTLITHFLPSLITISFTLSLKDIPLIPYEKKCDQTRPKSLHCDKKNLNLKGHVIKKKMVGLPMRNWSFIPFDIF
jgi:hypothetical protein